MTRTTRRAALAAIFSVLTVAASLGLTARADDEKITGDLKKIQGTWVTDGAGPDSKWTFEGENLKATVNGADYTCTVKLDEKAKPHRSMDIAIKEGAGDSAGKSGKGIYKFDGAKLVICITMPGVDQRPSEFKSIEGETHVFELKKD